MVTRRIGILVGVAALCGGLLVLLPAAAQEPPPLATNTPPGLPSLLATNTPPPGAVPPVAARPDAPFDRYALRLWTEADLVNEMIVQIRQLKIGDTERQLAIRLLQYELQQRFPGAPRSSQQRAQLLDAMFEAPRGSVDKRLLMRAALEAGLNQTQPAFSGITSLNINGFGVTIMPANADGILATLDAVLHTRYPAVGETLYEDYTLAQVDEAGTYRVLDSVPPLPSAPLGDVFAISLERLGDVNNDGADELSLVLDTGDTNKQLLIYGWRGGQMVNLIAPGENLRFGQLLDWPLQSDTLTVRVYRVESAAWGCLGEQDVSWRWNLNYFRPLAQGNTFTFQNRLACLLYGLEPIFEKPVQESLNRIEGILQFAQPDDQGSLPRARMVVAMLYLFDDRAGEAVQQVQALQSQAEPGSWLALQTAAFLDAAAQPDATPIQVCAALEAASQYGACDVDQALTRLFSENPLRRDEPIEAQLAALGITVLDKQTITAVGKRDRQAFRFDLAGDRWWAFAPLQADVYTAEKIEPLPGYESRPTAAPPSAAPPASAYDALLQGSPTLALNILDNIVRDNSGMDLNASGRFLQALAYDLLADRASARSAYFALWSDDPASVWGQLAAAHLERR